MRIAATITSKIFLPIVHPRKVPPVYGVRGAAGKRPPAVASRAPRV
jgi:hypothetical protein